MKNLTYIEAATKGQLNLEGVQVYTSFEDAKEDLIEIGKRARAISESHGVMGKITMKIIESAWYNSLKGTGFIANRETITAMQALSDLVNDPIDD